MPTLREVRSRIAGVKKTQKITKAMKMVAAAKLRRAQTSVIAARPYARMLRHLLEHLASTAELAAHPFVQQRDVKAVALVVVTSDRGLCGAFNANLLRAAVAHIESRYPELLRDGRVKIFCAGRKGADFFSKRDYTIGGKYVGLFSNLTFAHARGIAREAVRGYEAGEYDTVEVVYNEFKSVAQQKIVVERFLPLVPSSAPGPRPGFVANYIYEPSSRSIVEAVVPKHLNFQMWRVLLESNASEQGARMAAMDNATENANDLIESLQLLYNKARQASITKELLEVVSGAEALKKAG